MKNTFLLFIIMIFVPFSGYSQTVITIYGDINDSTVIKKKLKLESKGFNVKIEKSEKFGENQPSGDIDFINKYMNSKLIPFEYVDIKGNLINSKDFKGKLIHINFWSTTCKPCIEEFPELNELKNIYADKDFIFLAFAPESKKKVAKILSKYPLNYHVIAETRDYYKKLGINGYPKNFFVDREGVIIKVTDGTNYRSGMKDGKIIMIPDNFKIYTEIMQTMK